jgi:S-adenosylmethionine:tRNA ribosyltransferase-isomerase
VEVLLLRERYADTWECLVKPGRRLRPGAHITFGDGELAGLVVDTIEDTGGRLVRFTPKSGTFLEAAHRFGEVPLPPYITRTLADPERYQTIFARHERSAAAPTAGLHFTEDLLARTREAGVGIATVELDVGLDTFRPVLEDDPALHKMHQEHFRVPERAAGQIEDARAAGGRIIAVGTTTVRALESAFDPDTGSLEPRDGTTDLFITPGYRFGVVDAVVTNFHMPRSTLLMMVSAFTGREVLLGAYKTALAEGYRFLSFGDAMLIV